MVHVKIHLDTRRIKSDGTFNIIFRITQFKKVYTISSGISVGQKHWNSQKLEVAKTHPHSQQLNLRLSKQHFEIQRAVDHIILADGGYFSFSDEGIPF